MSVASPIGRAIFGRPAGAKVAAEMPTGEIRTLEIVAIRSQQHPARGDAPRIAQQPRLVATVRYDLVAAGAAHDDVADAALRAQCVRAGTATEAILALAHAQAVAAGAGHPDQPRAAGEPLGLRRLASDRIRPHRSGDRAKDHARGVVPTFYRERQT